MNNKEPSGTIWRVSIEQGANGGSVSYDAELNEISVRKN